MGKKLNLKWVTDTIGNDYKNWRRGDIVLLQAQTGTGKTYFIKNTLIDSLFGCKDLLLVCNRVNLKRQLKIDLLNKYGLKIPKTEEGEIDFEELDKLTQIRNITITSYHAIQNGELDKIYGDQDFDLGYYNYIICDECHYILTDSSFNNTTRLAYKKLIQQHYPNSIKMFISATLEEVKDYIVEEVKENVMGEVKIREYTTGTDYSYLNVKYFKENKNDLLNTIINDKDSKDKWLMFVTNKNYAEKVKEHLDEHNIKSEIIVAGTQNKELENIIQHSKFECKVLITTKAMDNGINIQDDLVKNVVIMAWDKITFIQELGRKRINIEDAQEVNLYIPMRNKKSFTNLVKNSDKKFKTVCTFANSKNRFKRNYNNDYKKLPSDIFYLDKENEWQVNKMGFIRLQKDKEFYERMEVNFGLFGEFTFTRKQLNWLGLSKTFDYSNLIENVALEEEKDNLKEYLNSIIGRVMLESKDRKELIENIKIIDSHNSCIKKNKIKYVSNRNTLNSYLLNDLKLDFYIKKFETSRMINGNKKNFKSAWKVLKVSEE